MDTSKNSSSFYLLDSRIQHFIWIEGWETLHDIQEGAIPHIVQTNQDVIIAASTAMGKTEAAFFPALTNLLHSDPPGLIVYVSPLKALINDQFSRLDRLCQHLEIAVWPWHGDVTSSMKAKFLSKRQGVLLITPESLEATLCNRGTSVASIFRNLSCFIVDELHAFIGSERGKQLQSLMHRIESVIDRTVPRIGLSATLGDMKLAAEYLRPGKGDSVALIVSTSSNNELRIMVKGYEERLVTDVRVPMDANSRDGEQSLGADEADLSEPITPAAIAKHLFKNLRGTNNLIFPNSRREVERYTFLLNRMCSEHYVPREFWPHHGSLSKEIRSDTEVALKQMEVPASAICTNTLELGIDIGAVKSIAQIGPPPSVASLRQRLGRSGRKKGEPAILRGYCIEHELGYKSVSLRDELRFDTVKTIAMISLLLEGWFEPPKPHGLHFSTLVQQVLSFIAQNGGATVGQLYHLFCSADSPFRDVGKADFLSLIRHLGLMELIVQDSAGLLLHGPKGEKYVNHFSFYTAFMTDEEFRIICAGKVLGSLPVSQMLTPRQRILFAGKTWVIESIDEKQKCIYVMRAKGGIPPAFSGGAGRTHTQVHQRMRGILESSETPIYLDNVAKGFLDEARKNYRERNLSNVCILDQGSEIHILTWLGDDSNDALSCIFRHLGLKAHASGPGIEIIKGEMSMNEIVHLLKTYRPDESIPIDMLLSNAKNLLREKWDWALPDALLRKSFASLFLNIEEAHHWLECFTRETISND